MRKEKKSKLPCRGYNAKAGRTGRFDNENIIRRILISKGKDNNGSKKENNN